MSKVTEKLRSPTLIKALELAQEESRLSGMLYVASDHFLLGLIRCEDETSEILIEFGCTLEGARQSSRKIAGTGSSQKNGTEIVPYTPRANEVLLAADKESNIRQLAVTHTQDLLSAMLLEKGLAFEILMDLLVDVGQLAKMVCARELPAGSFASGTDLVKAQNITDRLRNDLLALPDAILGCTPDECIRAFGKPASSKDNELTFHISYLEGTSSTVSLRLEFDTDQVVVYHLERKVDRPSEQ